VSPAANLCAAAVPYVGVRARPAGLLGRSAPTAE
jgi:hypothetical protein